MSDRAFFICLVFAGTLSLAGCGEAQKSTLAPVKLDQRLSEIYARTCMGCHTVPDSGAPQSHNEAMWAPRMKQSEDVLLAHIVDGFGGMPPLGQCVECSAEDLTTLMHFMAAPAPTSSETK
ncbi:MAG: c-type cytochrome [Parvibaculaceae bacterium]